MEQNNLSIGQAINDGWNGFKEYPGPAIGGFFLAWVILFVLGFIPLINIISSLFITPAFVGGFAILSLNLKDRNDPQISNVFDGFSKYGRFLGLYWLILLIVIGCYIPGGILVIIGAAVESTALIVIGAIVGIVVVIIAGIRLCLCFLIASDTELTAPACIQKSFELTKGNSLTIFLWYLAAFGITIVGVLCLFIGVFVTTPIVWISLASVYRQLAGEKQETKTEKPAESKA
ncbi:MAG: hypothetical protein ACOC6P_00145 [Candidatus Aminicenantaceae bacterium]